MTQRTSFLSFLFSFFSFLFSFFSFLFSLFGFNCSTHTQTTEKQDSPKVDTSKKESLRKETLHKDNYVFKKVNNIIKNVEKAKRQLKNPSPEHAALIKACHDVEDKLDQRCQKPAHSHCSVSNRNTKKHKTFTHPKPASNTGTRLCLM
jgi:hypothetical protein